MIANYRREPIPDKTNQNKETSASTIVGLSTVAFPNSTEYSGYASAVPANASTLSNVASNLMTGAGSLQASLASNLIPPALNLTPVKNPENEDAEKNPKPMKEDGMLVSLVKIILGVLTIPGKFATALSAIMNASAGITLSTGGLIQIAGIAVFHIADMFKISVQAVIRHVTTLTDFAVKLPKCFLVHIIKMIFAVLYLIFPLSSYVVWSFTGVSLMSSYDWVFNMLDEGDNWISDNVFGESKVGKLYLLKFPAEITKYCYYCNGKPYRLNDIIDDLSKVGDSGKRFANDVEKKAVPTMKPAVPFMLRTKKLVDKLMK
jgi:hypothetical protein